MVEMPKRWAGLFVLDPFLCISQQQRAFSGPLGKPCWMAFFTGAEGPNRAPIGFQKSAPRGPAPAVAVYRVNQNLDVLGRGKLGNAMT